MKWCLLPLVFLALHTVALADPPPPGEAAAKTLAPGGMPIAAADKPWSIVGPWFATHTAWRGMMTLVSDGSILNSENHTDGQWNLIVQQGQLHLLIRWKNWPTDDLAMVNANEFYGTNGRSELRLSRQPSAAPSGVGPESAGPVEIHSWRQGEPWVKLIRQDEGFCALTSVTGHFEGSAELVKVFVAEDGFWYLGGTSQQNNVGAECIVVRYHGKEKTPQEKPPQEKPSQEKSDEAATPSPAPLSPAPLPR